MSTQVRAHLLKITKAVKICLKVALSKLVYFKKLDNDTTMKIEYWKKKCPSTIIL